MQTLTDFYFNSFLTVIDGSKASSNGVGATLHQYANHRKSALVCCLDVVVVLEVVTDSCF